MPIRYTNSYPLSLTDVERELISLVGNGDHTTLETRLNELEQSDNLTENNMFELLIFIRRKKTEVSPKCTECVLKFLSNYGYGNKILDRGDAVTESRNNIATVMGDVRKNLGDLLD